MRPSRHLMLLLVGLMASGCVHTSTPNVTAARPDPSVSADLDSFAYARRGAPPSAAHAQVVEPSATQAQAQPSAAHAQALPAMQPPPVIRAREIGGQVPVAVAVAAEPAYTLDTGDKLRLVVFGQDGL